MKNSHSIIGIITSALLLQACNAGPETPRPITHTPQVTSSPQPMNENITSKDMEYASLLQGLSQRNPEKEAQQAAAGGERNILGYYAGRGGLKLPGLTPEQQAAQKCTLKTLDGLGDVIYGDNHLKYRVALRKFAGRYNLEMLSACL